VPVPLYAGFVNGDGPASLTTPPTCGTGATTASPVGSYATTCAGAADPNYIVSYVTGTVAVLPAALTVTADNQTMRSGAPVPALTATMTGFVNGQTLPTSDVTGAPQCTTAATTSSPPGSYPISCSNGTLLSADYQFAFGPGTLTVTGDVTHGCHVDGDLRVGPRQSVRVGPGCWVHGRVIVYGGGRFDAAGATIHGSIAFTGSGSLRICGSSLSGDLTAVAGSGSVVLGDGTTACPGDQIRGDVVIVANNGPVSLRRAEIHGLVGVELNSGGVTITDNFVRGPFIVLKNAAPVVVGGNRVDGPERVQRPH
jgi:hypothetical protein